MVYIIYVIYFVRLGACHKIIRDAVLHISHPV